jgi:signal transduction histidine kinase
MLKKLRLKFICTIMALVTVMLGVVFGMVYYFTSKSLETESVQMMQTLAANPFQLGIPGETQEEVRLPYFILQISQNGDLLATDSGYYDLSDQSFLTNVLTAALYADGQTGILKEYDLRFYRVTTRTAQRIVFADISSELATLDHLIRTCLLLGGLSLLGFFVLSLLLTRQMVKPIERAWDQQRQFVADASHELKTPLTVILTNAELLQSPDCGGEEKTRCADSILTMSHQMRGLVEGLLDLARVDNGTAKMAFEELNLSQLVDDAVLPFEPLYFEQGLTLDCQAEPGLRVKGSPSHLRQVVDVLLDNAQKYSAPQGTVTLELKRQGNHCLLSVSSPGAPISQADLKNIFKRFYRVDQARAMDHSYGLGLPIAQGIVEAHRGKIWAQSSQGRNTFFVQLPAA